jgi:hypothetical protein
VVTSGSRLHGETKTLGQRPGVLQETVDMLARTHGRASEMWLLGQVGDEIERHGWDMSRRGETRRRHRFALLVAVRTLRRHRQLPGPTTRRLMSTWAREAVPHLPTLTRATPEAPSLTARLGSRLSDRTRARASAPYHQITRWIRRKTIFELEPRLQELERALDARQKAIDELRAELVYLSNRPRSQPAEVPLDAVLQQHQLEEAIVHRFTGEIVRLQEELDQLRARADDA